MLKCNVEVMKEIKRLEEERVALIKYEDASYYVMFQSNEEPLLSDYEFEKIQCQLEWYDKEIRRLRVLLAHSNVTTFVEGFDMTISEALFYLEQLKYMSSRLQSMSRRKELERHSSRDGRVEYTKLSYSPSVALEKYNKIREIIPKLQMAIDRTNLTNMIEC